MNLEIFVSNMMKMNHLGRLWHWGTSSAQHHITFEKFLTENEEHTDSFVESILGNHIFFDISQIKIEASIKEKYDINLAQKEISHYRDLVRKTQKELEKSSHGYENELISILDGVNELCSKTLYLLNLK